MRGWTRPAPAGRLREGCAVEGRRCEEREPERGSQTVEWVGIGAVVVALVAAVIGFIPDVGAAVADAVSAVIEQVLQDG